LNSLGIDLLDPDFVLVALKSCRETIALAYCDILADVSSDATLQLLADITFLEIALSGNESGEFNHVREILVEKVQFPIDFTYF
jgi:hypothetical protein